MKSPHRNLPLLLVVILSGAAILHGPIAQLPNYHDFADKTAAFGIPHLVDVLSNLGFAFVAIWGWWQLAPNRQHPGMRNGWAGYRLFLIGLFLTAIGSSYYHLDPDDVRLVGDRIPIALVCSGLLAGVWGETRNKESTLLAAWLAVAAVCSVAWWYFTAQHGVGDLRPYLLLQSLPLLLIPLWQWIHARPHAERCAFGGAILLYVVAKFAELNDHEIAAVLGALTGHTLKHLLASGAAALVVACLIRRVSSSPTSAVG